MYLSITKRSKSVISFILICLFTYFIAVALLKILEERTLGSIFRYFLPTIPILFLIILLNLYDIKKISFSSFIPTIPSNLEFNLILKRFALILLLVIPLGLFILPHLAKGGLLIGPVVVLLFISLFISCFYMIAKNEIGGVIIFLAALPFLYYIQLKSYEIGLEGLKISEVRIPFSVLYLIIISICFFIGQYQGKIKEFSNAEKKFIKLCAFFVLMPVFSIIFSKDHSHSFVYYFMDLFLPIIYFFILMRSIETIEDIKKLIFALVISVFLYEFCTLYFMYRIGTVGDITTQLYGSEIYTGFSSVMLPLMIPFQIAMYNLLKGWKRIFVGLTLIIFIIYLFLSNYRTAIAATFIGFIIFYFFIYRTMFTKKIFISILILLLVIISVFYVENVPEKLSFFRPIQTFQQLLSRESIDIVFSGRTDTWRASLNMIHDYPLFGIGPDMWSEYIPKYTSRLFWYKIPGGGIEWDYASDPHNLYILIWINYGILNLIFYLFILYFVVMMGARNIKESSSNLIRTISVASFISLIIWIIMSFFTMRFFNHSILLYAVIFWSIIVVILKLNKFNSTIKA